MVGKKWIIKDLLKVTTEYLCKREIDNPRLCAEILLAYQLETSRVKLYLSYDQPIGEMDINNYRALIQRRIKREPVQYITGIQEFWSLDFHVGPQVLIPRPESEILVELAVSICREQKTGLTLLDLGTGSGAIAVSLAKELENSAIIASDISREALDYAKRNAQKHNVIDRIRFFQGDLFEPFLDKSIQLDIIITNPPYVDFKAYDDLH